MLAPPNDFGYSPATHHHAMGGYDQQHHHSERPKLFLEGPGGPHAMHHAQMGEYMVHGGHAMTPQHHHQGGDFDHEPLMMNMHNPQSHFYPPIGQQMLHVSTDYASSMDGTTPSARNGGAGSKRSREDLNLKEKKRMFKLNDRINQLKTLLDEAGVQSKKNKQSILDNTYHYVGMLRSNLLIAKQKAERAEKQAEMFRSQKGGASDADNVYKCCFMQSSTPRLLVDADFIPVTYNQSFLHQSGLTEDALKGKSPSLRSALCMDTTKFETILKIAREGKPMGTVVQARSATGVASITLMVSPMTDESGNVATIEFSIIPMDGTANNMQSPVFKGEGQETSPAGVDLEL